MMLYVRLLSVFIFLLASVECCRAQYYRQYNRSTGPVSNNVYKAFCDSKGYMWFGTDKGVTRFNGREFKTFTTADGMADNEIYDCYEDMSGRIWFYTFNGKLCYYKNGTIYNKTNDSSLKLLAEHAFINAIYEDKIDSALYFVPASLAIQKLKGGRVRLINLPVGPFNKLRTISNVLAGIRVTSTKRDFLIKNDTCAKTIDHEPQESYYYNQKLIVANEKGIALYDNNDKPTWNVHDEDVGFGNILHLYYDGNGHIFCGTRKGLIVYNIRTGKRQLFFDNVKVTSSQKDLDGNYWITTFNNGIYYFGRSNLEDVTPIKKTPGYDIITPASGQVFLKKDQHLEVLSSHGDSLIFEDINLRIPVTGEPLLYKNGILYFYNPVNGGNNYAMSNRGELRLLNGLRASKMFAVNDSAFLFFSNNEIILTDVKNRNISVRYSTHFRQRLSAQCYVKETQTMYFMVGKNQLYKYIINMPQPRPVGRLNNPGSSNYIFHHRSNLYILSNNGMVYVHNTEKNIWPGSFKTDIVHYGAIEIDTNRFLLNTDRGYAELEINKKGFTYRGIEYPFHQTEIDAIHYFQNRPVCKVGDDFYSFSPDVLNKYIARPRLYIDKIWINGSLADSTPTHLSAINKARLVILPDVVYLGANDLLFRYRVTEGDAAPDEWQTVAGKEFSFSFSSRGNYKIELQVSADGKKFFQGKTIYLDINPSFFTSVFFKILCITLLLFIVIFSIKYLHKKRELDFANELNYLKLEHRATGALLNPHFVFNAISNIQNLINQNSGELAGEYLATLSVMIRKNIDNLQYSLIPLTGEIELVRNYIQLQNLRFNHKIGFEIVLEGVNECHIPPLLIQTFIENAIVHGYTNTCEHFKITVNIRTTVDNYLAITVRDNGKGLKKAKDSPPLLNKKSSLGISFTEKRLKRLSRFAKKNYTLQINDLSDETDATTGTEVLIIIYGGLKEIIDEINNNAGAEVMA